MFSEQGVVAVSNGYRIKDYIRTEYSVIFVRSGASSSSSILKELIAANTVKDY